LAQRGLCVGSHQPAVWLWNDGVLRFLGLGPKPVQEPHRVENQIDPELLTIKPAASEAH